MQSKKYDKDVVESKFHQLLNAYDGQIKLGSLFYIASNYDLHPIDAEEEIIFPAPNYKLPRTAQERMSQAKKMPKLVKLLGNIWCKEEIHILFGDNGTGKSVWATQIADALSRGQNAMPHLMNEAGPQNVLFYDFELSDRQFFNRYTDNDGNEYSFSNNLTIDNIDFNELAQTGKKIKIDKLIIDKIVHDIKILKPDVLIVDNITFLKTEANQDANVALELIKSLISIKREFKISIMILAHTPKVKPGMIITNNDLAGSKHISNLVDSISAIGQSALERTEKYIKSIKCRSTEMEFDAKNVIVAKLEKQNSFLKFNYQDQGNEFDLISDPQKVAQVQDDKLMRQEVIRLHLKGETTRAIEDQTGVSKSTASRIINSYKIDDNILL
jgi:RecA-family ATPase